MAKFPDWLRGVVERHPILLSFALFAGTLAAMLSTVGVDRSVPVDRVIKSGSLVVINLAIWIFIFYVCYSRLKGVSLKTIMTEKRFFLLYGCFIGGLFTVFLFRLHWFLFP